MANKKITELPFINTLSGSTIQDNPTLNTVLPVVLSGTTNQITVEGFSKFMNLYTATTGSAGNIFAGPQTINNNVTINGNQAVNGNVSISGRLTVNEVVAQYETASILFSTGSTKLGDQITDKHEFTGSTNITGSFFVNGANLTDFSASNSATFTNYSSSNSATFTNFSSSNSTTFTNYSSSNSTLFTNTSSSINNTITAVSSSINTTLFAVSSSNSATFTNYSSSNSTVFTNYSSSNSTVFTNYSSSNSALITNYSSSINSTILDVSSSINTNIYAISSSIDSTIKANLGATNDVVYRIQQATASIQSYTASLKTAILPNGTNLDVIGNFRVSGSTTLGDTNTDKVEITGSVNVTGYVSASGINIYSTGTPEILSTNNLRLTADSSVVITTDNSGTAKVWDFDNGGTINLPGGATISTPNTVDVIVAAGSAGAAQLANFNKGNYFAINDTLATINVDAGATNKVWQFTNVGSINLPGSIIKPDGGEYSASLTLTSSFHAFTASIGSTSNDYRIELNSIEAYTSSLKAAISVSGTNVQIIGDLNVNKLNVQYISSSVLVTSGSNVFGDQSTDKHEFTGSVYLQNALIIGTEVIGNAGLNAITASTRIELNSIEAYTASLKGQAIVSSSTQIQNYDVFALNSNLYTSTGSLIGITNGLMALTASMKAAAIVSSSQQIKDYITFVNNDVTSSMSVNSASFAAKVWTPSGTANQFLYQSAGGASSNTTSTGNVTYDSGNTSLNVVNLGLSSAGTLASSLDRTNNISLHDGSFGIMAFRNGGVDKITTYRGVGSVVKISGSLVVDSNSPTVKHEITGSVQVNGNIVGSLLATNGVVSSSQQITNYYKFAETASANTKFYGDVSASAFNVSTFGGTTDIYHTGGGHTVITNSTANKDINYQTTGTGEHYFNSDVNVTGGNIVIGTAGNGIDFSANTGGAGKSSQLLDDYEEGTITGTITCGTSGTVTLDAGYNTLSYTKIGGVVHVFGNLSVTSVSSPVGYFTIPLPFACVNLGDSAGTTVANIVVNGTNTANTSDFVGWIDETQSNVIVRLGNATGVQNTSANELKALTDIYLQVTYRTT